MATVTGTSVINSTKVRLTVTGLSRGNNYVVTVYNVTDACGNPINTSHRVDNCQPPQTKDIVIFPATYTYGSMIELYLCGLPTEGTYPAAELQIDGVTVATFTNLRGNLEKRIFRYSRYYYLHYEQVDISQIKVVYTNDILGSPAVECLRNWSLDPLSTAVATYEYTIPDRFARITLAGTSGDPSALNSLRQTTAKAMADRAISTTTQVRSPVGVQARLELWTTDGGYTLQGSANMAGTGDWEDLTLTPITLTGALEFNPEVRMIVNSPDAAGAYADWKNIYAEQELISNPNFTTTLSPWYLNSGTNVSTTLKTDETPTYVRCTLIGVSPIDINHYNSIVQHIGSMSIDTGTQLRTTLYYRCPVGTTVRVSLFALPWGAGVVASTADFAGTGSWEAIPIKDTSDPLSPDGMEPLVATDEQQDIELRLLIVSPNQAGTWCDWRAVSVAKSLIDNSDFVDRSLYVDKVLVDGVSYETEAWNVWSTGTWIPADGPGLGAGYRQKEVLTNNGHFDYAAVDDATLLAGADARIDTYRKGDCTLTVLDNVGAPLPGATVTITQTKHEFLFGCNFFHWPIGLYRPFDPVAQSWGAHATPLTAAEQLLSDNYRARWQDLFNFATMPFYWVTHEGTEGVTQDAFKAEWAQWCIDHDISTKGHALFWAMDEPDWLASKSYADAKTAILREVSRTITNQAGLYPYWDVINESSFEFYTDYLHTVAPATMDVWEGEGHITFLQEILTLARATDPTVQIMINDYDVSDASVFVYQSLDPATFDLIGIQAHFHEEIWSNQKIWHVCNRFGAIKNVHLSEVSVLSGIPYTTGGVPLTDIYTQPIVSWPTTTEGEAQQAIDVARFYKMAFSNQYVSGITYWDVTDYDTWMGAPRGLIRTDMSVKPAFTALYNLIKGEWWTTSSGTTDGAGQHTFRGFAGRYSVTVTAPGLGTKTESKTLTTAGAAWTVSFVP